MEKKTVAPETLVRCHQCHKLPDAKISDNLNVLLVCYLHPGNMAMGADMIQATEHWNRFITFMAKEAA